MNRLVHRERGRVRGQREGRHAGKSKRITLGSILVSTRLLLGNKQSPNLSGLRHQALDIFTIRPL